MAPVEITAFGGRDGPTGQWARSPGEIEANLGIIGVLVDGIAASPDRTAEDLNYGERYTLGLRAAARWSLGISGRTPLTGDDVEPDPGRVVTELAVAEYLIAHGSEGCEPAAGVRAWLTWLTGETDHLVFKSLEA